MATFDADLQRAIEVGLRRGITGVAPDALIGSDKLESYAGEFLPFTLSENGVYKSIILVSRDFPPNHGGGIATFSKDLAEALATSGHIVHVVTQSPDFNRVDFENGVWVHRLQLREFELPHEARERSIPQHIWNWSATALEEAKRISTHRRIDAVEAPIWDCEGVAFLLDRRWPLITSLHTTLDFWLDSHPHKRNDYDWINTFFSPMLSLERELMTKADGVRANSKAIVNKIEQRYQIQIPIRAIKLVPHGMAPAVKALEKKPNSDIVILFVGRLELRKGIDIFLQALPLVFEAIPNAKVRIIGDNSLVGPDGFTFMDQFKSEHANKNWLGNVCFKGRVGQDVLLSAYESCDIFVAPSRFESFGLIFLEAMREGKPVIGCNAGGMPEVVSHGVNGLLVEPGDTQQLTDAILQLGMNGDLRQQMGEAGKRIFEEKFTAKRMAEESFALYDLAKVNFADSQ